MLFFQFPSSLLVERLPTFRGFGRTYHPTSSDESPITESEELNLPRDQGDVSKVQNEWFHNQWPDFQSYLKVQNFIKDKRIKEMEGFRMFPIKAGFSGGKQNKPDYLES